MVSSINTSVRLFAQQAALNAFRETSSDGTSNSSSTTSGTSLADYFYSSDSSSDDDDFEDTKLSAMIASLQQSLNGGGDTNDDGSVDDMSSKAFMKALRDKIESLKENPDTAAMADGMLKALDAGTLTVTNAEAGEKVAAFDPQTSAQTSAETVSVETTDWSSYLKDLLARDTSGKFIRNGDSSYIEKATGASSYFGMVGDAYYYISWTAPAEEASTDAEGATATGGTSTGA